MLENAKIWKYVMVGEMSGQGNVLVGKCPVGEVSVGEVSSWGSVCWGSVSRGSVLKKVSVGELSRQETVLQSVSLICSGEMVDLKILESDWLRPFWPISQEKEFS